MSLKAIDRYSQDYIELQTKDNVKFLQDAGRRPEERSSRSTTRSSRRSQQRTRLFKEILQSQIKFAERATRWEQDTVVNRRMAFDHYFGANGAAKKI